MPARMVLEPFHLTQRDSNITEADGTANTWSDIWSYQVPRNTKLIITKEDKFAAYLEDASAQVGNATCQIEILMRDPSTRVATPLYGPALYIHSKEFQDDDLIARLEHLAAPVEIPPRWWLIIRVKDDGAIDASDSQFDLYCHRARDSA